MKVLVILCIAAHFANAIVPPFNQILSGGSIGSLLGGLNPLGASTDSDSDQDNTASGSSGRFGGLFGSPRQLSADVLGVKINLLSALRNTLTGDTDIDFVDNTVGGGAVIDGTGSNLSGFGESSSGAAEVSSQAFSAGSAFAQMGGSAEGGASTGLSGHQKLSGGYANQQSSGGYANSQSSSAGYANQQSYLPPSTSYGSPEVGNGQASNGYNYNRPSAGYSPQVQAPPSNGGYNYQRPPPPPPPQNTYIPASTGNGHASNGGYNYQRPPPPPQNTYIPAATGNGYASNGGYNYNRPPPQLQNSYGPPTGQYASQSSDYASSSGSAQSSNFASSPGSAQSSFDSSSGGEASISQIGGASEFSSGDSSLSQSAFSGIQATSSDTIGLSGGLSASGSGSATTSGNASGGRRHQGRLQGITNSIIRSGVQVPISLLTSYRSGINRGFDTLANGIDALQRIFSGGNSNDSADEVESESRLDVPPPSASFGDDFRRRIF